MGKYQKLVVWSFNGALFSAALTELHETFSWHEIGELVGVSGSCAQNWGNGNWTDRFQHPNMSNFLAACDQLDLDPREFFIQEDVL